MSAQSGNGPPGSNGGAGGAGGSNQGYVHSMDAENKMHVEPDGQPGSDQGYFGGYAGGGDPSAMSSQSGSGGFSSNGGSGSGGPTSSGGFSDSTGGSYQSNAGSVAVNDGNNN